MQQQSIEFTSEQELYDAKDLVLQPWLSSLLYTAPCELRSLTDSIVELHVYSISPLALCSFNGVMGFLRSVTLFQHRIVAASFVQFGACCIETVSAFYKRLKDCPPALPFAPMPLPAGVFGIMHCDRIYKIGGAQMKESNFTPDERPVSFHPVLSYDEVPSALDTAEWAHDSFVMPDAYGCVLFQRNLAHVDVSIVFDWSKYATNAA